MGSNSFIILFIIIVYYIGIYIHRFYSQKIKGAKGEHSVARLLRKLNRKEYKIFNDIYIKTNGRITQIDHIVVSIYGIFVIETKNYKGWIHGSENSEYWSQSFYKKKIKFRNPVKQNWAHIYFLKNVLSNFKQEVKYHSIIVFVGKAKLKNIYSKIPVIYKNKLLKTIKLNDTPNLSIYQLESIVNQLNEIIINDKTIKKEHKKYVKRNIYERKKNVKALICPNCGGKLAVRKGKYGKFYGCSNFPKCKFSKKL